MHLCRHGPELEGELPQDLDLPSASNSSTSHVEGRRRTASGPYRPRHWGSRPGDQGLFSGLNLLAQVSEPWHEDVAESTAEPCHGHSTGECSRMRKRGGLVRGRGLARDPSVEADGSEPMTRITETRHSHANGPATSCGPGVPVWANGGNVRLRRPSFRCGHGRVRPESVPPFWAVPR